MAIKHKIVINVSDPNGRKDMDQMVYTQVIVICTTINVITIISTLVIWIGTKIHDRREKKMKEREEKAE